MKPLKEISVFFPAFNEVDNIGSTVLNAHKVLEGLAERWEIIVVDDGSTDATGAAVKKLTKKIRGLRLVTHTPNRGYGAALKTGIQESQFELICYTDSDGQFDFTQIHQFVKELKQGADMVIGFRIQRTDNLYRRLMANVLRVVGIVLFGINVRDVDCGFKLFKRKVVDTIGTLKTSSAITETELVTRAHRAGFKIEEVGVRHHSRPGGEQTGGKPSIIVKAALEGIKLSLTLNLVERWKK